jgi:hypothetical protein
MKTLALVSAVFVVAFASVPLPIVQVRDVPTMPYVGIIGWEAGEADYGLRTRLRRDGSHLGENRVGEHRLFLNAIYVEANGGFNHATVHNGKLLRNIMGARDTVRDVEACSYGNVCSPDKTIGLGVSDEFLRQNRDSIVVTMRPRTGRSWIIRLDRNLIDAYLGTMDSVAASLKK